ncbi:ABC transporter ATP-binding protein [Pseudomonas sessilinigenes]|uniref:ABC transporter ATP-binding protein/permease n=1 Tax=Pseudomonas sessilinigenes TaxID=658629 RepID=A0ABX8MYX3_9PSED|nr:ABC transporter ATP-binding protein [Pseudomonas sessilinigenes]AZC23937.1 Heterodimeric efflux ABC transporter, permease/ATP-binding subunit 2 [Pseudomonas sessilinigenes]QXH42910.1 ABC transporter ATP-binding protein/permease [Pseudomonas sessilinigenes]
MLKTFIQLLGEDVPVLRRYAWMAVGYGLLSGLTITALVPLLGHLLAGDTQAAIGWLALLLAGVLLCWLWRRRVERAGVAVGVAVLQGVRLRMGEHIARLPVGWFTPEHNARLGHVITQGMMAIAQLPAHVFTPLISAAMTPLAMVVALGVLHWPTGLLALLALPLLALAVSFSTRLGRRADSAFHAHFADTSQRMVEFAQAQSVLRAFNGEQGGTRLLRQAIDQQRQSAGRLIYLSSLSSVLNTWVVQGIFAALLVSVGLWLERLLGLGLETGPAIALAVTLVVVSRFVDPLLELASYGETLRGALGQLEEASRILAVPPLSQVQSPQAPGDASVELQGVSFAYGPGQPEVLRDVSLRLAPGSMTALIGASGSGKTSLARLIARFFEVDQGSVRVGGVDVRQMSEAQLAGHISQIFQDSYLFQGSIADNIRLGDPEASAAQVMEAARQAGVVEIIERLAQGIDTQVGEGGARLSGGERQRIAIARALLKQAPILLVDEATAALDAENQAVIAQALARLRGQCTLVVIAHQLSTVAMADQIVVLEQGRVVEQGTPDELRARPGYYARLLDPRGAAQGWRIGASR